MAMGLNPNTITAANSIVQFRCAGLYDDWITIEGAQSDAFVTFSDVTLAQTRVGVDGKQSMGFIPHETPITVSLEANSRSVPVLETVYNDFIQNMEVRRCEFQISYPSVKRKQTLTGTMVTKSGGTGIAQLLNGHTYNFNMMSSGIEETN
ncbi:virion structural protein [Acinetobacter phage WCHABP12]|uniref:Tail tube protein n=3 Tax=Obolenskvirus TaxID=1915205 RepID=A0A1V0DZ74_9CAUD|nr:virion structural protein [Acinetobacter phage LZ35]YP_009600497.1 virion structural protein [Acinetobacter phage WCHABP12]YP_009609885.1 virion structural protein [Acinetobacter phage AbP2]AMD43179.1 hypothetical protein YD_18 [Acinetobacter phage LZ35]ARB06744.1 hypothetical protein ABP12_00003 [Acinetobacter phage WCHABP12]ASJ78903.1 hypothetical protein ABP2_032 [Acinetobacter phage AbP2]